MKNLKKIRLDRRITLYRLSSETGISNQMLSNYELNKTNPPLDNLIKLADYFNVSLDYLCGRQNSNLIFADSLTEEQKKIVSLVKGLTHDQSLLVLGYLSNMLKLPYEEVRPVRPNF